MNTGLDPEILAISDGYVVPAEYFLPPPKEDEEGRLNQLSYDNAAIEMRPTQSISTSTVASRLRTLMMSAVFEMDLARDFKQIPSRTRLSLTPAAMLEKHDTKLESVSRFGCSPSFTLDGDYRRSMVEGLCGPDETRFRSAGFHIHQELPHKGMAEAAVAVLDGILGLTDVLANKSLGYTAASNTRRCRIGYGRAGEHRTRIAPGGLTILEYRVLSPWPLSSPESTEWVIEMTRFICKQEVDTLYAILNDFPDRISIIMAINSGSASDASRLLKRCVSALNKNTGGLNAIRQQFKQLFHSRLHLDGFVRRWVGAVADRRRGIDTRSA